MNRLTIIGNLTNDPELRTTPTGKDVCSFTVAVNRRGQYNTPDYFRVASWGEQGKNCKKFLSKGKKVAVVGAVSCHAYNQKNGEPGATLDVMAEEVEFLSPKDSGFTRVEDDEDNPFGG